MTTLPLVKIDGLQKAFLLPESGKMVVFEGLTVQFEDAQITALLGPTGCGKTTLLSLINGLMLPDSGSITFPSRSAAPRVGTVLQKDLLLPWRDVSQNALLGVEVAFREHGQANLQRVLKDFGLSGAENLYPDQLSGGMRRKVSLIRTLLFEPDLVLFDEPFANIDYYQKLELESYCVRWIRKKKRASIFVTHDIEEAIAVADRIVVLSDKPARILLDFPLDLSQGSPSDPIAARRSAAFRRYFEEIWTALKRNGKPS